MLHSLELGDIMCLHAHHRANMRTMSLCACMLVVFACMQVPGQTVEQLLLKYARASQRSPSDPTIVFVAR